jgi:hypothetical protein
MPTEILDAPVKTNMTGMHVDGDHTRETLADRADEAAAAEVDWATAREETVKAFARLRQHVKASALIVADAVLWLGKAIRAIGNPTSEEVGLLLRECLSDPDAPVKARSGIKQQDGSTVWKPQDEDAAVKQYGQWYKDLARWTQRMFSDKEDKVIAEYLSVEERELFEVRGVEIAGQFFYTPVDALAAGIGLTATHAAWKNIIRPSVYDVTEYRAKEHMGSVARTKDALGRHGVVCSFEDKESGIRRRKRYKVLDHGSLIKGTILGLLSQGASKLSNADCEAIAEAAMALIVKVDKTTSS